ncbi:MAG: peptidoglycan editing factor PgeF [Cyanobacteria bacterium HKST-UBA06]|nr:peptidoglycan editing factor PgeF [Cyanobacteria bacterium HKST-UBA06]
MGDMTDVMTQPRLILYPSRILTAQHTWLAYAVLGKPHSMGGPAHEHNPSERVAAHRQALCRTFALPPDRLICPDQVHGHVIRPSSSPAFEGTDGVVLADTGYGVLMNFADCVPVVLVAPTARCAALLHAGWRGTAAQIARLGVETLAQQTGCAPETIQAVLGPAISGPCYEVDSTVVEAVVPTVKELPEGAVQAKAKAEGKYNVDLRSINRQQLREAGVETIEILPYCTVTNNLQFFSHRCGEPGRNGVFIHLK